MAFPISLYFFLSLLAVFVAGTPVAENATNTLPDYTAETQTMLPNGTITSLKPRVANVDWQFDAYRSQADCDARVNRCDSRSGAGGDTCRSLWGCGGTTGTGASRIVPVICDGCSLEFYEDIACQNWVNHIDDRPNHGGFDPSPGVCWDPGHAFGGAMRSFIVLCP
ncbi:MAG: hypothetical protein M1836_003780 [Candelina mexicana]|nr:MAG: hypothetical protein M1836_003780 [Candelina mexicana]